MVKIQIPIRNDSQIQLAIILKQFEKNCGKTHTLSFLCIQFIPKLFANSGIFVLFVIVVAIIVFVCIASRFVFVSGTYLCASHVESVRLGPMSQSVCITLLFPPPSWLACAYVHAHAHTLHIYLI